MRKLALKQITGVKTNEMGKRGYDNVIKYENHIYKQNIK